MADHQRRASERRAAPRAAARCGRRTGPGAPRRSAPGPGAPSRAGCRPATAAAAAGTSARRARERAHRRLAGGQRDHQRREGDRAAEQRVVEHRHLDDHARAGARAPARRPRAPRWRPATCPCTTASARPEVVEQRDDLRAERRHRVAPLVARAVGLAVAEQVERDHAVAARRPAPRASGSCMRWLNSRPCSRTVSRGPSPYRCRRGAGRRSRSCLIGPSIVVLREVSIRPMEPRRRRRATRDRRRASRPRRGAWASRASRRRRRIRRWRNPLAPPARAPIPAARGWPSDEQGESSAARWRSLREDVWGLSLLVVRPDVQSSGARARSCSRARTSTADGARGRIILASPRTRGRCAPTPGSGCDCTRADARARRARATSPAARMREGDASDIPFTEAVDRPCAAPPTAPTSARCWSGADACSSARARVRVVRGTARSALLPAFDEDARGDAAAGPLAAGRRRERVVRWLTASRTGRWRPCVDAGLELRLGGRGVFVGGDASARSRPTCRAARSSEARSPRSASRQRRPRRRRKPFS